MLSGYAFPSNKFKESPGVRLLRGVNITSHSTRWDDIVFWPQEETQGLDDYWLKEGDIVFGMDRPWISTGVRMAKIQKTDLPALLLQRVVRLRAQAEMSQDFLGLILSSEEFKQSTEIEMTGVSVPHISPDQILSYKINIPSHEKQIEIVKNTYKNLSYLDKLINGASESISLMQERRSALISAAVTGKIDVRDWQPPKAGQTASEPAEASA